MKLSKEQQLERQRAIDHGIALVGLKRLEYLGKPAAYKSWERREAAKHAGNKARDRARRGRGEGSAGAKHVAKAG